MPEHRTSQPVSTTPDTSILKRLRRIEGQIRGLQRMLQEGRDCPDILVQLSGARSALDAVGDLVLEQYASTCRLDSSAAEPADLVRAIKLLRR